MTLTYHATTGQIEEIPQALLDQWAAAGNPKAQAFVPIPDRPHPQAQFDGAQWLLPPLESVQEQCIRRINQECTRRLIERYGPPERQLSISAGLHGDEARAAWLLGVEATVAASNVASDAILTATTVVQAEAVTATWPELP